MEKNIKNSYGFIMREYFLKEYKSIYYSCINIKKYFYTHYELDREKLFLERDGHSNKTAHELVEKNISKLQTS